MEPESSMVFESTIPPVPKLSLAIQRVSQPSVQEKKPIATSPFKSLCFWMGVILDKMIKDAKDDYERLFQIAIWFLNFMNEFHIRISVSLLREVDRYVRYPHYTIFCYSSYTKKDNSAFSLHSRASDFIEILNRSEMVTFIKNIDGSTILPLPHFNDFCTKFVDTTKAFNEHINSLPEMTQIFESYYHYLNSTSFE